MSTYVTFLVAMAVLAAGRPVDAARHWLTGVTVDGQTVPISARIDGVIPASKAEGVTFLDIVISIYQKPGDPDYPAGDNDGNTQGNPGSEEQDIYEQIIQYMADGIFESTEGQHKLRNVCIYRFGARAADADIIWEESGVPSATRSGAAGAGGHIFMFDDFNGHNHLADKQGAGYGLAHNIGHYFYGLETEFPQQSGDVGVRFSVMNDPWAARNGNYEWLNFSVPWRDDPPGDYENTRLTQHHREYSESCWETLVRDPVSDPKQGDLQGAFSRLYFPDLSSVAPVGFAKPVVDLRFVGVDEARSHLNIIWKTEGLIYQIVLDRSGSMQGMKIENAKTAAKLLVEKAIFGESSLGVVVFDSVVQVLTPITPITDQATKDAISAQIDGITAGGTTAVGDASQVALDGLAALGETSKTKIVFLLSDGQSNTGVAPLSVIPAYQFAKIPIFTFAYGTNADTVTLGQMATDTGGEMFISPTSLADVTLAFERAFQIASGSQGIASGVGTATPSKAVAESTFMVDSTVGRLELSVVHEGSATDAFLVLRSPTGAIVPPTSVFESVSETLRTYSADMPVTGEWTLRVASLVARNIDYSYQATALPDGTQYAVRVESRFGNELSYPQPMLFVAALEREAAIAGATVTGVVTRPNGVQEAIALRDDGTGVDEEADDGYYSAVYFYDDSGLYTIETSADNFAGAANLTYHGHGFPPPTGGPPSEPHHDFPVGEIFQRESALQVRVTDVQPDDHGNTWQEATPVTPDNSDTPGRTETAADVDFFSFRVPAGVTNVVARVSGLVGAFAPRLRVYDQSGGQVLSEGTLDTASGPGGYVNLRVPVVGDSMYFASVSNDFRRDGWYQFGVGPAIQSDTGREMIPPAPVRNFTAVGENGVVSLIWTDPTDPDLAGVRILRKQTGFSTGPLDGQPVFDGLKSDAHAQEFFGEKGGYFVDVDVTNGVTYYYTAFAYDTSLNFSQGVGASAIPGTQACFIATAAYGSALAPDLKVFRAFRDQFLLTNALGAALVDAYYATSPPIADFIAEHAALRLPIRAALMVLAEVLRILMNAPYVIAVIGVAGYVAHVHVQRRRRAVA